MHNVFYLGIGFITVIVFDPVGNTLLGYSFMVYLLFNFGPVRSQKCFLLRIEWHVQRQMQRDFPLVLFSLGSPLGRMIGGYLAWMKITANKRSRNTFLSWRLEHNSLDETDDWRLNQSSELHAKQIRKGC